MDSDGSKEGCVKWGAHWRHLANTTEPSMRGGDGACCQITLTVCYYLTCLDSAADLGRYTSDGNNRTDHLARLVGCCHLHLLLLQVLD